MADLITISVKDARFHSFHGYHEEERKTGNEFVINLSVQIIPPAGNISGIGETVNYVTLFEILREEMDQPRKLLETLLMELSDRFHQRFPSIKRIQISITKLNPPIYRFNGKVSVDYSAEF